MIPQLDHKLYKEAFVPSPTLSPLLAKYLALVCNNCFLNEKR